MKKKHQLLHFTLIRANQPDIFVEPGAILVGFDVTHEVLDIASRYLGPTFFEVDKLEYNTQVHELYTTLFHFESQKLFYVGAAFFTYTNICNWKLP